jgi:ring-1,2-phenylacetyl-CoA epoxidase subunit PaaE
VQLSLPVRDVLHATPRAVRVTLALNGTAFPYLAGQAILIAPYGSAEKKRPYSLTTSPREAARNDALELLIGINADGRTGTSLSLEPGALVDVDGPLGRFTFPEHPQERRFLFIGGGTGIAPLRAMLHVALAVPHEEIGVLYSARAPSEFAYEEELRQLAEDRRIELELRVTRDEGPKGWTGTRGRLSANDLRRLVHGRETLCFVCGPPTLVDEIPRVLEDLGVPRDRIRREEWTATTP